jgi:hypothetical protein
VTFTRISSSSPASHALARDVGAEQDWYPETTALAFVCVAAGELDGGLCLQAASDVGSAPFA